MENEGQQSTAPAMKNKERPVVDVKVNVVVEDANGGLAYRLEARDAESQPYVCGDTRLKFPFGEALYKVRFHVEDDDCSYNLKFDKDTPIHAHDSDSCPTSGGVKSKQLGDKVRKDRQMVIDNFNSEKGLVGFALLFMDKDSDERLEPFDPIMDNGGGGIPKRL